MIKLLDLIEAKQVGTLYHWTSFDSLIKILKSNELKANINEEYYDIDFRAQTNSSFNVKPHVSFTRSKGKVWGNDHIYSLPCALEIDGDKLSNNYQISPYSMVDYPKIKAGQQDSEGEVYQAEYEERVYNDIKNIDKYIKAIILDKIMIQIELKSYNKEDVEYLKNINIPIKYINQ